MADPSSTTALDAIKSVYPAQYYGLYDATATAATKLSSVLDVWNGVAREGGRFNLLTLPAASALLPLTADQWDQASGADNIWVKAGALMWPNRYYAVYDTTAAQPALVTGWVDAWKIGGAEAAAPPAVLLAPAAMLPMTAAQWADTAIRTAGMYVRNGEIIAYTPPVPLATQATTALTAARASIYNTYGVLNETTPDTWVAYLKALMAIANGTDTTSTALPTAPSS